MERGIRMSVEMANKFVGLTKMEARRLAENHNLIFRLIRNNKEKFFDYPEDMRDDRICVELNNGAVVKAVVQ